MIAKLSDFFILLFSASVFGGIFFLLAEILYRTKIISAGENYLLLRSTLIFHLISPIFAALFFVRSAKPTILPASGADFDQFIFTELPISYPFYDFYRELRPLPYLFMIWFIIFLTIFLARIVKNHRLLTQLQTISSANTNRELELLKNQLTEEYRIRRPVQIQYCTLLSTPMISNIFHITIFFPQTKLSEQYTEFILRHELIHCRRNDIFYKYLFLFVKSFYWFNPLLPLFSRVFHERCEISCDESLLDGHSRREQFEYAKCIAGFAGYANPDLTAGFYCAHTAERRIAAIAAMHSGSRSHRKKTKIFIGAVFLLLLIILILMTANGKVLRIALGKWMEIIHITML